MHPLRTSSQTYTVTYFRGWHFFLGWSDFISSKAFVSPYEGLSVTSQIAANTFQISKITKKMGGTGYFQLLIVQSMILSLLDSIFENKFYDCHGADRDR